MPRKITPATELHATALASALKHLRVARVYLKAAGCATATAATRKAIKSAEGAERHMRHRIRTTLEQAGDTAQ